MSQSVEFNVDYSSLIELQEKIMALPGKAEYEINNYLWGTAGEILEKAVYSKMPKSKYKKYGQPRSHAKESKSLEIFKGINLMVKVETRTKPKSKDFGYLIFPNEGRGIKQINKGAQEFFEDALSSEENRITNELINHLTKKIEEEI